MIIISDIALLLIWKIKLFVTVIDYFGSFCVLVIAASGDTSPPDEFNCTKVWLKFTHRVCLYL